VGLNAYRKIALDIRRGKTAVEIDALAVPLLFSIALFLIEPPLLFYKSLTVCL
jgi:hypothetical protein